MNLSIVVPVYNEEDSIERVIEDISLNFPFSEIIIIDDKSTDRTAHILNSLSKKNVNLHVFTNPFNLGHGKTIIRGLRLAKSDYILYIDADRQIDINNFFSYENDYKNYSIVSGYRANRKDKLFRKVISFILKATICLRHGYYIRDANCPFKIYNRKNLLNLIKKIPDTKIIPIACIEVLARKEKYKTKFIRIEHKEFDGIRKGFLQSLNLKTLKFFYSAFIEIISL